MGRGTSVFPANRRCEKNHLGRADDADVADARLNRDEGCAIGRGRTGVAPRVTQFVFELDLEGRAAVSPTDRDVAAAPNDTGDARWHDAEGFDCVYHAEVIDENLVGGGNVHTLGPNPTRRLHWRGRAGWRVPEAQSFVDSPDDATLLPRLETGERASLWK